MKYKYILIINVCILQNLQLLYFFFFFSLQSKEKAQTAHRTFAVYRYF